MLNILHELMCFTLHFILNGSKTRCEKILRNLHEQLVELVNFMWFLRPLYSTDHFLWGIRGPMSSNKTYLKKPNIKPSGN